MARVAVWFWGATSAATVAAGTLWVEALQLRQGHVSPATVLPAVAAGLALLLGLAIAGRIAWCVTAAARRAREGQQGGGQ